ncbi:ABC transporter permease [Microbacterium trichothecenolyticum]|uniref:ABC transporter permease n=1 Tax=Microbacterium ureisolvens TaxID=2781186 RepID=A0ABS7HWG4_9MICO|nr:MULTISPECIES: ABC transporter permease [Microbacterium]MBW9108961.1 ABC transporter permease [Microbacterium ureisolvens]MBW9119915.1 ABC transporter permease [Microbacterium trichothecenolyticum]
MAADVLASDHIAVAAADRATPGAGIPSGWAALLRRPTFVLSALVIVWWVVVAIGWRWFGIDPFANTGVKLAPPSPEHWLGTDRIGRDVLARVLAGAESALIVAPLGTALATVLGATLGLVAGYRRGWVDQLFMRSFDVFLALPTLIFLLVVVGAFGSSPLVLALAIGVLFAPGIARIIRAEVLVEMGKDYVTSAQVQGERTGRILGRELLPNVWPQVVVQATLSIGGAVFVASSLSFLGLAAAPPSPDWGLAVSENRAYLQGAWWTLVFPTLAIASLVVSVNLLADNLKEVLRR